MTDWTDGVWLDGQRTADWLEDWLRKKKGLPRWEHDKNVNASGAQRGINTYHGGDNAARAIYRWRHENVTPTIYSLDRMLTRFGGHVSEIPDDLWIDKPPQKRYRVVRGEERVAALRELETESVVNVARRFDVSEKTVRNWKKKAALAAR